MVFFKKPKFLTLYFNNVLTNCFIVVNTGFLVFFAKSKKIKNVVFGATKKMDGFIARRSEKIQKNMKMQTIERKKFKLQCCLC